MSVSNLTNTIWVLNNQPSFTNRGSYSINFINNNNSLTHIYIGYLPELDEDNSIWYEGYSSVPYIREAYISGSWQNQAYRIIEITGGTDVTNASLIAWLEANATQVTVTDLTDTKWIFKSIIDISGDAFNAKEIIFKSIYTFPDIEEYTYGGFRKRTNYLGETYLVYCDDPTEVDMPEEYAYGETSHWGNQILRIIEITGGNDVSNPDLLLWLNNNATLVPVVDLSGTEWVFNDVISLSGNFGDAYINFTSNGDNWTRLEDLITDEDRLLYWMNSGTTVYRDGAWTNNAYKTISITNGTDITNPDLIVWLSQNATLQPVTPTKTFDLSTLQLSAGTHTIQVKARASGYRNSEFSNSVSYVVAPPTFNNVRIQIKNKGFADVGYRINGGEWVFAYNRDYTDNTYNNVTKVEIALPDTGGVDNIDIFASNSTLIQSINEPDSPASNPLDITEYLQDGCNIEIWADD